MASERVPLTTLDALLEGASPPDCLQIDVEGMEWAVLSGGSRALGARPPLMIEINRGTLAQFGRSPEGLVSDLGDLGYRRLIVLRQGRPEPFTGLVEPYCNVFAFAD